MSLDQQNNEMRKKLRALTVTMQSAGRDEGLALNKCLKFVSIALNLALLIFSSTSMDSRSVMKGIVAISCFTLFLTCRAGQRLVAGQTEEGQEEIWNPRIRYCTGVQFVIHCLLILQCHFDTSNALSAPHISQTILFLRCDIASWSCDSAISLELL